MTTNIKNNFTIFFLLIFVLICGCKKFVEISPSRTQIVESSVYNNDATATAVMTGMYSEMMSSYGFASGGEFSVTFLAGMSADELTNYASGDLLQFSDNTIEPGNGINTSLWSECYSYIYTSNAVIGNVAASSSLSSPVKKQLTGEAKFMRAFCNFYLVNLFGPIPNVTSTDYRVNDTISRASTMYIYNQIIADLSDAQNLLDSDYSFSNGEKVRPDKWAATALLARVYLYTDDWQRAEEQSSILINNTSFSLSTDINTIFLANSSEAIWQLIPNQPGYDTEEGLFFILNGIPSLVSLTPDLVSSFEQNDLRRMNWIDSITVSGQTYYYPYKYKIASGTSLTEYSMVLRLAEQYLIRAEARTYQNNFSGAQSDLNAIRNRAGLPNTTANDQPSLLLAVEQERQAELFTEWGHRWLDLKRTGRADAVLGPLKSPNWKSTDTLYPIPNIQLQNDPHFSQNAGY